MNSRLCLADGVELAVLNNVRWYEAMFRAHGLPCEVDELVWISHGRTPRFHSNLVVLSPKTSQSDVEAYALDLDRVPRAGGWSLKDSYARFELSSLGFTELFSAEWMWRDPVESHTRLATRNLTWTKVPSPAELIEWEDAWGGDARNEGEVRPERQFPESLLADPAFAFYAGRIGGEVVAGGIAIRSPGVVGLSNVFSPEAVAQETWIALVDCIAAAFPSTPIVGYERGPSLELARGAGFVPIGALRVWSRTE